MSNDEGQEKRGFKVEDRRRFSETGDVRPERVGKDDEGSPPPATDAASAAPESPPDSHDVEINFTTFLLSLSTQALAHLGEIPNPISQTVEIDLGAAKQLIDILGVLKEKTQGNLDKVENGLLESVLYDLRLKYVERARSGSPKT
jgi:hypothetical protein